MQACISGKLIAKDPNLLHGDEIHEKSKNFTWLKYATKKENSHASTHEPMHLPLTAKAAAWYQDAAACLMLLMLLKCDIM